MRGTKNDDQASIEFRMWLSDKKNILSLSVGTDSLLRIDCRWSFVLVFCLFVCLFFCFVFCWFPVLQVSWDFLKSSARIGPR